MNVLREYYEKYNEEKRLLTPYGRVEYETTMKAVSDFMGDLEGLSILDVGCATGRYAVPLAKKGHSVLAIDPVPYHRGILNQKIRKDSIPNLIVKDGNALSLRKFGEDRFDVILFLGPMYHLFTEEDKVRALSEAKACLKAGGAIFVSYIMNEFAVLVHGFRENAVLEDLRNGKLDPSDYHVRTSEEDLFSYDRISDIDRYREKAGLQRIRILSQDGAANYMRETFKTMDEETFSAFLDYHFKTCADPSLLGAGCHTLDILTKE